MTDIFSKQKRSEIMSKVKSKDTKPELIIRKSLHKLGFRYRLHVNSLPGKPDLCFPARRAVIFVHGCQWHWHGCRRCRMPISNQSYWLKKIGSNVMRDEIKIKDILRNQWRVLIIWECVTQRSHIDKTIQLTIEWLNDPTLYYNQVDLNDKFNVCLIDGKSSILPSTLTSP
ncbi:very short patch repair endonuclease [Serratia marcescens]|uniref:very short patch repair endonuclease n=1 Tax=Serratia marcescens TaxID=615 RepID=UPI0003984E3F|nr:DNA mismatch endonuclease Vsr [Serratia marcescens]ERH73525.1 Fis family transcriptional regulator [Serratia marcescens EGD-HP20]OZT18783.1 very short patch repair endonuclease [Serratia marcescens]